MKSKQISVVMDCYSSPLHACLYSFLPFNATTPNSLAFLGKETNQINSKPITKLLRSVDAMHKLSSNSPTSEESEKKVQLEGWYLTAYETVLCDQHLIFTLR